MHIFFPDIDAPISENVQNPDIDQSKVDTLVSFGFEEKLAHKALKASVNISLLLAFTISLWGSLLFTANSIMFVHSLFLSAHQGGDVEKATEWIFSSPSASTAADMDVTTSSGAAVDTLMPDGGGSKFPILWFY